MPEEHESTFASWLDSPETQREMDIIRSRFIGLNDFQIIQLALQIEILDALHIYGDRDAPDLIIGLDADKPDEDEEPWKDPDNTGWKP